MTEPLLNESWINYLSEFTVLYIGLSGGLDSTVLLHSMLSQPALCHKLHAIHINHGLSPQALSWELHCQQMCHTLSVKFSTFCVQIDAQQNVEERARIARYDVFRSLLTGADALILAHHQDDQAETLLLNLIRGAGIDGLAAMSEVQPFVKGTVIRPFLTHSRAMLEAYAAEHGLKWIEDESNQNVDFSRNFIRRQVMPLLKEKWPSVAQNIARGAHHCRRAKQHLETLAQIDGLDLSRPSMRLPLSMLMPLTRERCFNMLRVWIRQNGYKMPSEAVLNRLMDEMVLARQDANPIISFGGVSIRRYREHLYCIPMSPENSVSNIKVCHPEYSEGGSKIQEMSHDVRFAQSIEKEVIHWLDFPNPLDIGHMTLAVNYTGKGMNISAAQRIEVRFRTGGERLRLRGQTKLLKKLWQEWGVPPWMRDTIPLIYVDGVFAAVVGYGIGDDFYTDKPDAFEFVTMGKTWHNL